MDDDKDISSLSPTKIDSISLDDILGDTLTIDTSMANYTYTSPSYYSIGATGSSGPSGSSYGNITINTAAYNGTWSSSPLMSSGSAGLHVTSNAQFDGDVKIKGVSILETLEKIEKRLSILRPDPEKLAHFEALKKAYEHYKTLEALCELPTKEEE